MPGLPLYAAVPFDPASLYLTGFWRDFQNPNWASQTSAGPSGDGSHDWNDPGNEPDNGDLLNGYRTANFSSTDTLTGDGTLASYVGASSLSGWWVVKPDSLTTLQYFWGDSTGFQINVGIRSSGTARLVLNNSAASLAERTMTAVGIWALVTFRYNGVNVQVGVNEAPGAAGGVSSVAYSTPIGSLAGGTAASGAGGSNFFDGTMAEFAISNRVLSDADFNNVKSYVNGRYGLSL